VKSPSETESLRRFLLGFGMLFCVSISLPSSAKTSATLPVSVDDRTVQVSNITPSGKVLFFGVEFRPSSRGQFVTSVRHNQIESDTDGDGQVIYTLKQATALQAIWIAIDLTTGSAGVATPAGFYAPEISLPGKGAHRGPTGVLNRFETELDFIEGVVVRPGTGAWIFTAGEGGVNDEGAASDGKIDLTPARLVPLAGAAVIDKLLPSDTVAVVDLHEKRYYISTLK